MATEPVRTWKVRTTAAGAILTLNGKEYDLRASTAAIAFDLERAAAGLNAPESEKIAP